MSTAAPNSNPWYREPWPWLLMLPPALSLAGGGAMLWLAVGAPAELVVTDYARIEELTSERFARDAQAAAGGLVASVDLDRTGDGAVAVEVRLRAADDARPEALFLRLQHAAHASADREIVLVRGAAQSYRGVLELAAGRYDLEVSPADRSWRLGGSLGSVPATLELRAAPGAGE